MFRLLCRILGNKNTPMYNLHLSETDYSTDFPEGSAIDAPDLQVFAQPDLHCEPHAPPKALLISSSVKIFDKTIDGYFILSNFSIVKL